MTESVMPTYGRLDITFAKGEGAWLTDTRGERYLDALSGIAVCNLGHCHPAVTRAISEQAATLVHTSNFYHIEKQHLKERDVLADGTYSNKLGAGYTVEKVMPSPFRLEVTADIWTTNTDQKLQIIEQLLVLFNPSINIMTSDNEFDWSALTYTEMTNVNWKS